MSLPKTLDTIIKRAFEEVPSRNDVYREFRDSFHSLPPTIRDHRKYFSENSRGFGEDAFHSMWFWMFGEFRPKRCLEIGVYRGQVLTLWPLLADYFNFSVEIGAISPFSSAGDEVSSYSGEIDYLADTKLNHDHFNLQYPHFCADFSTSEKAKFFIQSSRWDLIYIDGSHDYDIVMSDFNIAYENLADDGFIVMDDASLYFDYSSDDGGFKGHPGPSRVANDVAAKKMDLIAGIGHNNIFRKKDWRKKIFK